MQDRQSFIETAMIVAEAVSQRSEDKYRKVGAVGVSQDGSFVSTGYNGLAPGFNLTEDEWNDRDFRRNFIIHAESNALIRASRQSIETLVVTMIPCLPCLNLCAAHGVKKIIYRDPYSHESYGSMENTHSVAKRLKIELTCSVVKSEKLF